MKEEIEEKVMISHNQTGFRKGMGTIDNIYIINYLINRQIEKKGGRMVIMFVDLKAAFDSIDREMLVETLRERGVRKGLTKRIEQVVRETRSRVRMRGKVWARVTDFPPPSQRKVEGQDKPCPCTGEKVKAGPKDLI